MTHIDRHCWMGWDCVKNQRRSKVNSAAVKPEGIGQEEDANMLDEAERKKFRLFAAALNNMSSDRSDKQYDAKAICTKMGIRHRRVGRD